MYILGLNLSHNSTACLLKDGEIIGCISEERFNRIKNYSGFPKQAVAYLLKTEHITKNDLDLVVNGGETLTYEWNPENDRKNPRKKYLFMIYNLMSFSQRFDKLFRYIHYLITKKPSKTEINSLIKYNLRISPSKILYAPHHICHAYAAYFGAVPAKERLEKFLIITHDAEGDMLCGLVLKAGNNSFEVIRKIPAGNSMAALYGSVTSLMGMKINEHEYKIMGLAPYASEYEIKKTYPLFGSFIQINGSSISTRFGMRASYMYLARKLVGRRFDGIAGALQKAVEEKTIAWIKNLIAETGIHNIALGGGFFMNVKVNKLIGEMKQVKKLFICPSSGDESNAIGAAYWGYEWYCKKNSDNFSPKPFSNLYLGPLFQEKEIERILNDFKKLDKFSIRAENNIERVIAELLSQGEIVARFNGRMEWGARALGNRSILADPRNPDAVRVINDQIKSRDFWMPFAPTILATRADDYLINLKKLSAPFMVLAFDTTELGRRDLRAAIHPYDYTARPQILEKDANRLYYKLIKEFEKLTGVGAVLNTSFNLHGEPIICSPEDAIKTFLNSGLQYLALENYLLVKK